MSDSVLSRNLQRVHGRIENAAVKAGRSAEDITLVAVTKYVDAETTKKLIDAGQSVLGESRPQVMWKKAEQLSGLKIDWHLIGHLQRNKINRTLPLCRLIHSVDSIRLLEAINESSQRDQRVSDCLLEVNISGESAKQGFRPSEIESALAAAADCSCLNIKGFMGMASLVGDASDNRREFSELRQLFERHQNSQSGNVRLEQLSMGMSQDFEDAIAEGSTIVRIGSLLFEGV